MLIRRSDPLQRARMAHERLLARQRARIERVKSQGRRRCRKQLQILEGLRPWANIYDMWHDFGGGQTAFSLRFFVDRFGTATLRFYEDGQLFMYGDPNGSFREEDSGLWQLLARVTPQQLLQAADDAANSRGHGRGTILGS